MAKINLEKIDVLQYLLRKKKVNTYIFVVDGVKKGKLKPYD